MEKELMNNIKTFIASAELVYQNKDYTSATILYFKTIFVALDLIIYGKIKITPKDHSERFRILKKQFPEEYSQLDKYFSIYRSTYSITIDKDDCDEVRNYVKKLLERHFNI
ncbi:MAG: hypothetical protein ABIG93_01845 [archaeon]|nr:hypothetical protein [Nanoarchaeota archaeon]